MRRFLRRSLESFELKIENVKIEKFEDLKVWRDARAFVAEVYKVSSDGAFARDFGLRDQVRRAAVSIMSNIAEGFERASRKEFIRFLDIAKASAAEVRSQLYVAADLDYISSDVFKALQNDVTALSKQLSGFIKYLGSR